MLDLLFVSCNTVDSCFVRQIGYHRLNRYGEIQLKVASYGIFDAKVTNLFWPEVTSDGISGMAAGEAGTDVRHCLVILDQAVLQI